MATFQIQKLRSAPAVTETKATQKQSVELVQTLLHSSISILAFLRAFFSEKAFDRQRYNATAGLPSYKDYINGNTGKSDGSQGVEPTTIVALRRNRSKRVDEFLDWLEKGAFAALQQGKLRALQIYVHPDARGRQKVIETYTFIIKYHRDGQGGRVIEGIEVDSPGRKGVTVEATTAALVKLLRHVMDLCAGLPDLPENRHISMALFLSHDKTEFQAAGFEPSTSTSILLAHADGWERSVQQSEEIPSGFHSASFAISHLQNPAIRAHPHLDHHGRIPIDLSYNSDGGRVSELEAMLEPRCDAPAKVPSTVGRTPSTVFPDEAQESPVATEQAIFTPTATSAAACHSVGKSDAPISAAELARAPALTNAANVDSLNTQSSDVPKMRAGLQNMLRPERFSQGDTQTQALILPASTNIQPYGLTKEAAVPSGDSCSPQKLQLLSEVRRTLQVAKPKLKNKALKLAGCAPSKKNQDDVVLCQCGHAEEEGDVVCCTFCGTWQHLHCYGFAGSNDPRLPDDHACYQCLLGVHDEHLLITMKDLALKRRAMSFASLHGLAHNREGLANDMGVSPQVAGQLLAYLIDEGFVIRSNAARLSTFGGARKPFYVPVAGGTAYDRLRPALLDPLAHIYRYYVNNSSVSSIVPVHDRAPDPAAMPPPGTPASQLRRPHASASRSRSINGGRSPCRGTPMAQRQRIMKRGPGEDIFSTPAKRQATMTPVYRRLKSVQTIGTINVDGYSSPVV